LTEQDGVSATEVALAEQRLGFVLPAVLRDFYLTVGRQPAFMSSFQQFASPDQWTVSGDKIVFLEENQGVCYWAADARSKVYQATSLKAPEWHEEPVGLPEFLRVMLYYQMAQGGYPFCGMISAVNFSSLQDVQALIGEMKGQPAGNMAGLEIFVAADQVLVWYLHQEGALPEPGLFLSALHEDRFQALCDKWMFDDLG
jgi:hypothetical protein